VAAYDPDQDPEVIAAREAAASMARDVTPKAAEALQSRFPVLPPDLDAKLLAAGERALGPLEDRPDLRVELRGAFWFVLRDHGLS
jgi:hypothetical protein